MLLLGDIFPVLHNLYSLLLYQSDVQINRCHHLPSGCKELRSYTLPINDMYSDLLDEISRAIGARLLLQFTYKNSLYLVEPYLVGKDKLNQDCLRAWQIKSPEKLLSDNAWDCFTLNEISDLKILDKQFTNKRPGYDPYDSTMKRIYYRI